jgi:hypothetical protein
LPELLSSHHEVSPSAEVSASAEVSPSVAERFDGRAAGLSADFLPLARGRMSFAIS